MGRPPFEWFARFGRGEGRDEALVAWRSLNEHPVLAARRTAALAALWSNDRDTARGALRFVAEPTMSLADIERYQGLAARVVLEGGSEDEALVHLETYHKTMSSGRLDAMLRHGGLRWDTNWRFSLMRELRRSLRPSHMPALSELTHAHDPQLRKQARDCMLLLAGATDQHRDLLVRALLEDPRSDVGMDATDPDEVLAYEPRRYLLEKKASGLPAELRAILERTFIEASAEWPASPSLVAWIIRWLGESEAGPSDARLLLRLLEIPDDVPRYVALVGLRGLDTAAVREAQRPFVRENAVRDGLRAVAMANLARLGDDEVREQLLSLASSGSLWLLAALDAVPEAARAAWIERAPIDVRAASRLARALDEAVEYPLEIRDEEIRAIAAAMDARWDLCSPEVLLKIAKWLPWCRSRGLAERLLKSLTEDLPGKDVLAFLEVHDLDALRRRLSELYADGAPVAVAKLLMELGAPEQATAVLSYCDAVKAYSSFSLARSAAAAPVRQRLLDDLRAAQFSADDAAGALEALAATAQAEGLEEIFCATWVHTVMDLAFPATRFDAWRERALGGDAAGALLDALAEFPVREICDYGKVALGSVDDSRATELLRRARDTAGADYRWAIGELAIAKDAEGLAAMQAGFDRALYGWHDNVSTRQLSRGFDLAYADDWIAEVETNAHRRSAAGEAMAGMCGLDVYNSGRFGLALPRTYWQRRFDRVRARLAWSRIAGCYVVGSH